MSGSFTNLPMTVQASLYFRQSGFVDLLRPTPGKREWK